jgi:phytoene/squalene synthetase
VSIVKAFRNLVSGEDSELSTAYAHFLKMVDQEHGAVRNAILAATWQLRNESTAIYAAVREASAITERTGLDTQTLISSTDLLEKRLDSMIILLLCPFY